MLVSMFSFFILFNLAPSLQYIGLDGKHGISRTRSDLMHVPQTPATKLLARLSKIYRICRIEINSEDDIAPFIFNIEV